MPESFLTLYATKTLTLLITPLGFCLSVLLLALVLHILAWRRLAVGLASFSGLALWLASSPIVAISLLASIEAKFPPQPIDQMPPRDVAIVLGGALAGAVPPRVTLDMGEASDRVLHASRLYKAGRVKRILVTGGNLPWQIAQPSEAENIRDLLMEWGVPGEAIQIAGASRNTYENALEIRALMTKQPFQSSYLVTSASHMPRSMAVFQRVGIPVTAAPTDFRAVWNEPVNLLNFLPGADALSMTSNAVREYIGLAAYRIRGFL